MEFFELQSLPSEQDEEATIFFFFLLIYHFSKLFISHFVHLLPFFADIYYPTVFFSLHLWFFYTFYYPAFLTFITPMC